MTVVQTSVWALSFGSVVVEAAPKDAGREPIERSSPWQDPDFLTHALRTAERPIRQEESGHRHVGLIGDCDHAPSSVIENAARCRTIPVAFMPPAAIDIDRPVPEGRALWGSNMNRPDLSPICLFLCSAGILGGSVVATHAEQISEASRGNVPEASEERDAQHDFHFNFGTWQTHVKRLLRPLTGSTTWVDYEGTSVVSKVWDGRASVFELDVDGPAGRIRGVGLRLYNPETRQWSLNWANGHDGIMTAPMIGEFKNGRGDFFGQELLDGRLIYTRNSFLDITTDSARFEQAYSDDGGKTWEVNWIMTFKRAKGKAPE